jgi:tetratricopeptide (TPR) repeat protein
MVSRLAASLIVSGLLAGTSLARTADDGVQADITRLEHEWSRIKYQVKDSGAQSAQIQALAEAAAKVVEHYPGRVEPLIWQGVITSSEAGMVGGFSALSYASDARDLFEKAGQIDYHALNGSIPTSLGALYYLVPGFPLGFGNNTKARRYLEEGVAISPDGLDSNFFYGDFLYQQGEYDKAEAVLTHALESPRNAGRAVWDAGRREEIKALLAKVQQELEASR